MFVHLRDDLEVSPMKYFVHCNLSSHMYSTKHFIFFSTVIYFFVEKIYEKHTQLNLIYIWPHLMSHKSLCSCNNIASHYLLLKIIKINIKKEIVEKWKQNKRKMWEEVEEIQQSRKGQKPLNRGKENIWKIKPTKD